MSEEEEINFNDDGDDDFGGQEGGDEFVGEGGEDEFDQNQNSETPEGKYQRAKGLLGFENEEAVDLFYDIFCDPNADLKIQAKSLKRAAITLSQTDDYERILGSLTDVFNAYTDHIIDDQLCSKIIRRMMQNIRSEQALLDFLDLAAKNIDKNVQMQLFIDVKLRQAEISLKGADYDAAQQELSDVEQFIGIPPDKADVGMCNSAVRVLFLKIELAEVFSKDEKEVFKYYEQLMSIPNMTFSLDRQNAVITKIEGQMELHNKNFKKATELFHESFKLFDASGSDRRLDCLPFLALSIMCSKDVDSMEFSDPQISPYINHPIVAPLKQLLDAYTDNKFTKFDELLESAKKIFQQKISDPSFYNSLLDDVRLFVLRNTIKAFCPTYKRLDLSFLSKELKCQENEAKDLVFDLIISHELHANVDLEENLIIMQTIVDQSPYLKNVQSMLDSLAAKVRYQHKIEKLRIE